MVTGYLTHPHCLQHHPQAGHPEQAARLTAIDAALAAAGLRERLHAIASKAATPAALERVHAPRYIGEIERAVPRQGLTFLDSDTVMSPGSLTAALHASGAPPVAVDAIMAGKIDNAFCAVRPPGHHAQRQRAMGFCIFNNVAVGVAHALEVHGLARVAIVDFDVHHGNGTEDIFLDDPRVLLCSSFQHPFYPFSGADSGSANRVPMPLPAGADGKAFRTAWLERGLPALERFQPQMIFFSAGFDAHRDDPLAGLNLLEEDFAWLTREVLAIAARHACGRVVSTLEGGYHLTALGRSAAAHVHELANAVR